MFTLMQKIPRKYILWILLIGIISIAAFFRLYKIREYLVFLGDEGRDVLIVKRMIVDHKFTLLGPITSIGSIYMGPVYYYMMIPFLWLWGLDPVGPAVMVAILALGTVYILFRIGSEYFHVSVGLVAALFYAISPLTIAYGKSSWNPNVVPFFAVVIIYSLLRVIVKKQYKWLAVNGFALGIIIQLHYVTLMFLPIIFVSLFLIRYKIPLRYYIAGFIALIAGYSPFLVFELRHQFVNIQGAIRILSQQDSVNTSVLLMLFPAWADTLVRIFWRLVVIENAEITKLFVIAMAAVYFVNRTFFIKKKEIFIAFLLLCIWLSIGVLSYSFYKGAVYDYYFGSLFPVPFLFSGIFFYILWRMSQKGKILALGLFITLVFFNTKHNPFWTSPSNLLSNSETIARFVYEKTGGQPYNFALIAGKNSDHAYRYFLEVWGNPPITIGPESADPKRETITPQLLVVCEEVVCKPLGHPLWEIAGFGRAEIVDQWDVVTAKVFRLVHYNKQ